VAVQRLMSGSYVRDLDPIRGGDANRDPNDDGDCPLITTVPADAAIGTATAASLQSVLVQSAFPESARSIAAGIFATDINVRAT
jgi:hypothetical protein